MIQSTNTVAVKQILGTLTSCDRAVKWGPEFEKNLSRLYSPIKQRGSVALGSINNW